MMIAFIVIYIPLHNSGVVLLLHMSVLLSYYDHPSICISISGR